jgi:hypothetical protein
MIIQLKCDTTKLDVVYYVLLSLSLPSFCHMAVATETPFHVLAVDDSLPDRKLIESDGDHSHQNHHQSDIDGDGHDHGCGSAANKSGGDHSRKRKRKRKAEENQDVLPQNNRHRHS